MTRSQAINYLTSTGLTEEQVMEVVEALEQEPHEDCISRQAVLEQTYNWSKDEFLRVAKLFDYLRKRINDLPLVIPQPKTGHWIDVFGGCECSECGCLEAGYSDYCPNCGTKMVEPQESEG